MNDVKKKKPRLLSYEVENKSFQVPSFYDAYYERYVVQYNNNNS